MEIQSFILCKNLTSGGVGTTLNAEWVGIATFYPDDGDFYPVGTIKYFYMLLRRNHTDYEEEFSLRFDLVDADGNPAGKPAGQKTRNKFPKGEKFFQVAGRIYLDIPAPGDYRLDITADEEGRPSVYAYNIVALAASEDAEEDDEDDSQAKRIPPDL
jgi:hypothetical protein